MTCSRTTQWWFGFSTLFVLCLWDNHALADNWQARIQDAVLPPRVVAVDKNAQEFLLLEKKSPPVARYTFPCTTGQVVGDKQIMNDLRTPEGVYFVEYKIANGLDFKEYGGIAYTLNYPNPVDKLRGKTGHGIWIHSKGFGIVPRDTRGCVAIGLEQIAEVGPLLTPGTAVLLAEQVEVSNAPVRESSKARVLAQKMEQWTRAWATRSPRMFEMYDEAAYTKAMPESFAAFKANKQRLFRMLPWINIFNREVHVLEGPGYWVTWSEQFYRAPNLSTEGIRRLYWQQYQDGKFRIVGMEWTPRNLGMQADFQKGRLVASTDTVQSDAGSEAPVPPPLSMPETADGQALAPQPQVAPNATVSPATPPLQVAQGTTPTVTNGQRGQQGQAGQQDEAPALFVPLLPREAVPPVPPVTPLTPAPSAAAPAITQAEATAAAAPAIVLDAALTSLLTTQMEQWTQAWQNRSPKFFDFYDSANYGKVSIGTTKLRTDSFRALKADMERRFRSSPWIHIVSRPVQVSVTNALVRTTSTQCIRVPNQKLVQGERSLYWQKGADGQFRIVNSTWTEQDFGMEADYLEAITPGISHMVSQWGAAWLAGNTAEYGTFYSPKAKQQGRVGQEAIIANKTRIWAKSAPADVQLRGLRVFMDARGVRADMTQIYRDSNNYEDKGTKTLLLEPRGTSWVIVEEDWAALPPQP